MDPLDEFQQCWSGLGLDLGFGGLDYNTSYQYSSKYLLRPEKKRHLQHTGLYSYIGNKMRMSTCLQKFQF